VKKTKRLFALVLAVLMLAALLSACGTEEAGAGAVQSSGGSSSGGSGSDSGESNSSSSSGGGSSGDKAPEFTGEIKIGVLAPALTSQFGQMMQNGVVMAIDETNAAGGINGYKLVPVIEDTQNSPDIAINATNKMLAANEVSGIIGPHYSSSVFAIDGLVKNKDIPFIIGGTNPGIPDLKNPNFYGCRTNDTICARAAAAFIASQPGVTKVAVLTLSDDFGEGGKKIATAYFDEVGMDYVSESFNLGDTDMSATIMKVKNAGCNGIFIWTLGNEFIILIRQLYELDFNVPTISNPSLVDTTTGEMCEPEWLEGKYCTADFVVNSTEPLTADFVKKFESLYKVKPDNGAGCYYSGALILFEAMKRCSDPTDRAQIAAELMKTKDFETPVGTFTARPGVNQQLIWGINIIKKNPDGGISFVDYVSA